MGCGPMTKTLIARFSNRIILPILFLLSLILISVPLLMRATSNFQHVKPVAIFVIGCDVFVSFIVAGFIKQFLFESHSAIWTEAGKLVYVNKLYFTVDCSAVEYLSKDDAASSKWPRILVHMRDGTTKVIPTGGLREPADVVLTRIRSELGISNRQVVL